MSVAVSLASSVKARAAAKRHFARPSNVPAARPYQHLVLALDSPTSGRIVVSGVDITRATRAELALFRRPTVSFIFQTCTSAT